MTGRAIFFICQLKRKDSNLCYSFYFILFTQINCTVNFNASTIYYLQPNPHISKNDSDLKLKEINHIIDEFDTSHTKKALFENN